MLINATASGTPPLGGTGALGHPPLPDEQFSRWANLLEKRTGIVLPSNRRDFLVTNLRSRMREAGFTDYEAYFNAVQAGPKASVEWAILVDRLTVHQTHFFRHLPSFQAVADWIDARVLEKGDCTVSAWSVGCSTGEEPYSLAMQIEQAVQRNARKIQYGISATDVSQLSLMAAKRGSYGLSKLKEIPAELHPRYLRAISADSFEVVEPVRRRVAFAPFNLLELSRAGLKPFDLIYCQNVMIYFSRERRVDILNSFANLLNPGGLLVIGSGEVTNYSHPELVRLDNRNVLAYVKPEVRANVIV